MKRIATVGLILAASALPTLAPATASAHCRKHACWHRVHMAKVERLVVRRIDAITPFRCYGGRWAVPCNIIGTESKGSWWAVNSSSGALGPYQFLGWPVPWPVVVRSHYETLKRMLAHHRMARRLWAQQLAGAACAWCY